MGKFKRGFGRWGNAIFAPTAGCFQGSTRRPSVEDLEQHHNVRGASI